MAWTKTLKAPLKTIATESGVVLPSSATRGYSSVIDFMSPDGGVPNRYVSILVTASAVTGTNLDIELYGAMTSGGTKFLLKDAVVADVTNGVSQGGVVDLNAYPAPFYYIGWLADADEHLNTVAVTLFY